MQKLSGFLYGVAFSCLIIAVYALGAGETTAAGNAFAASSIAFIVAVPIGFQDML